MARMFKAKKNWKISMGKWMENVDFLAFFDEKKVVAWKTDEFSCVCQSRIEQGKLWKTGSP
jgi:hypothetical protein